VGAFSASDHAARGAKRRRIDEEFGGAFRTRYDHEIRTGIGAI
jgi:hypothetical protein